MKPCLFGLSAAALLQASWAPPSWTSAVRESGPQPLEWLYCPLPWHFCSGLFLGMFSFLFSGLTTCTSFKLPFQVLSSTWGLPWPLLFTILLDYTRTKLFDNCKKKKNCHMTISFLLFNFYSSVKLCMFTSFSVEGRVSKLKFCVFLLLQSGVQRKCSINICLRVDKESEWGGWPAERSQIELTLCSSRKLLHLGNNTSKL